MYKSVSSKSEKVLVPELNLFSVPDTSVGVLSSKYLSCPLTNALNPGVSQGPIEWRYNLSKHFLNLQRSYLLFTIGIRDEQGKVIDVKADETLPLAFCQAIGKTLFKSFELYLNGVLVEETGPLYAFRSIIETELNHDAATKSTSLSMAGYAYDPVIGKPDSEGHLKRRAMLNKRGEGQFAATLSLNMFQQNRLLLNFMDLRLVAYLNDPKMVIDSFEIGKNNDPFTYEILDIQLMLHEYQLHETTSNAIEAALKQEKLISYPITNVEMRSLFVNAGRFDAPEFRLLTSSAPRRVTMCMVEPDSFHGNYKKSSFNFKPFGLKDAVLEFNGRAIPGRSLNLDFENDRYMPAYMMMLEGTGLGRSSMNNGITREMFKDGYSFFVFEVSPTLESDAFQLISLGTTTFNLKFNSITPPGGIYVLFHIEYDSIVTIDESRTPHVDAII